MASPEEVRARRVRRPGGSGFGVPRLVLFVLPLLFAAAALLPWALTQTVLVPTLPREPDVRLLGTAAALLFLVGLMVSLLLRAFLLVPVARAADAARRAADGDASAWPELEVATGAASDLGSILADLLRRGETRTRAEHELTALREGLDRLGEEVRAIAAGDWTRRPRAEEAEIAALAERIAAQAERSADLARAASTLAEAAQAVAAARGQSDNTAASGGDLDGLAEAADAIAADLARLRTMLEPHPGADGTSEASHGAAGAEAAQRLGLLALNASLEAGRIGGAEASKFGALAEELGREAERVRAALMRGSGRQSDDAAVDPGALALLQELERRAAGLAGRVQAGRARSELASGGDAAVVDWPGLTAAAEAVLQQMALVRLDDGPDAAPVAEPDAAPAAEPRTAPADEPPAPPAESPEAEPADEGFDAGAGDEAPEPPS